VPLGLKPEQLLATTDDPDWPVVANHGTVVVRFGNNANRLVELAMPEGRVVISARTPLTINTPRIDANTVVFDDVAPDTDLRFDVGDLGVTQRLILKSPHALRAISLFVADPDGALLGLSDDGQGSYELGSGDQTRLEVTRAYAYESAAGGTGVRKEPDSAHQTVTAEVGGYVVRSSVDEQWLDNHQFPVELDPDYAVALPGTTAGGRYNPMTSVRMLDTRTGLGQTSAADVPAQGSVSVVVTGRLGVPATGVAAVVVDVVAVAPSASGSMVVYPSGIATPSASTLSFVSGQGMSNTAIVKVGTNGSVTLFNRTSVGVDMVLDVQGWFSTTVDNGSGGMLRLGTPTRILDTRQVGGQITAAATRNVAIAGAGWLPTNAADISSLVVNVTAVNPSTETYLTVWASGVSRPVSTLNAASTFSQLVTTKIGSNGAISIYNAAGSVDVLVEIIGYYTPQGSSGFQPYTALNPQRIFSTITGGGSPSMTTPLSNGGSVNVKVFGWGGIPTSGVAAVALNVITQNSTSNGWVNVYDHDFPEPPGISTIQTSTSGTRQQLVIVQPAADGTVTIKSHTASINISIDSQGWFALPRYAPTATWQLVDAPPSGALGFATGQSTKLKLTVTNNDPSSSVKVEAVVPPPADGTVSVPTMNGAACPAGTTCAASDVATVTGAPLAAAGTATFEFPLTATSVRGCGPTRVPAAAATVAAVYADGNKYVTSPASDLLVPACEGGLGFEDWWSYDRHDTSPGGSASVNMGNGNLVVQQTDSTAIQAHGDLAFVARRTYNSQDSGVIGLPGAIGRGWTLNLGELSATAGAVVGAGLQVPSLEAASRAGGVVLVDRDGTKHLFQPAVVSPLLLAPAGVVPTGPGGTANALSAQSITVPTGYTHLCIDQRYTAPAGVHLSLWRYVAVTAGAGVTDPCTSLSTAPSGAAVVGYAAMRPDRLRTEYDAVGRLRSMLDGAGNEFSYSYPTAGGFLVTESRVATSARTMTLATAPHDAASCGTTATNDMTLTDPAGRLTRYCRVMVGATPYLVRVVDPDGKTIEYGYHNVTKAQGGTATCDGTTGQICSVKDRRNSSTMFTYAAVAGGSTMVSTLSAVASITDRRGKTTTYDYHYDSAPEYMNVNRVGMLEWDPTVVQSRQRVRYSGIDAFGRVTQIDEGSPSSSNPSDPTTINALRQTQYVWDKNASSWCDADEPENTRCLVLRKSLMNGTPGATEDIGPNPDALTTYRYNAEGALVSQRQHTNINNAAKDESVYRTFGYRTQFVSRSGTNCWDDRVSSQGAIQPQVSTCTGAGAGAPGSGNRGAGALFYLADLIESVTPNGNTSANAAIYQQYRTNYVVDNDVTKSPNARIASTGESCTGGVATGNSGLTCRVDAPSDGTLRAVTDYRYDGFGQLRKETKPQAFADSTAPYVYTYYDDSAKDLSGTTSAGGWLKAVTDPANKFVVFAYDAAGNVVRSWDRNVTSTSTATPADYPGTTGAPTNGDTRYTEDEYEALPGATAKFKAPWRSVLAHRSQLDSKTSPVTAANSTTTFVVDENGNVRSSTPPRGQAPASTAFTTLMTYDAADALTSRTIPSPTGVATPSTTSYRYDDYGRLDAEKDPTGGVVSRVYDEVDRLIYSFSIRANFADYQTHWSSGCFDLGPVQTDSWVPAGKMGCVVEPFRAMDGLDNPFDSVDLFGYTGRKTFDGLGRMTVDEREFDTNRYTRYRYDADGNQIRVCSGRSSAGVVSTWIACDDNNPYAMSTTYTTSGRVKTTVTRRQSSAGGTVVPFTTTYGYNRDGNVTSESGPVSGRAPATIAYDVLGRKTCSARPRSHDGSGTVYTRTMTEYDPSGDVTGMSRPIAGDCASLAAVPSTAKTTYTYDAGHRRTDVVDAPATSGQHVEGGTNVHTRYEYDVDGNVVAVYGPRAFAGNITDPAPGTSFVLRTTYDNAGRPEIRYTPRSGTGAAEPTLTAPDGSPVTTQADDCPAATTVGYPASTRVCRTQLVYDAAGRIVSQWLPTSGTTRTIASSGRGARHVDYTYTEDGRLATISTPAPEGSGVERAITHRYYGASDLVVYQVGPRSDPNDPTKWYYDTMETWRYGDGQPYAIAYAPADPGDGTSIPVKTRSVGFTYDLDGNRSSEGMRFGPTTTYAYYSDGRLESTSRPSSRLGYDGAALTYDSRDTTTYEYDGAGNTVKVYAPSANATGTPLSDTTQSTRTPTTTSYSDDDLVSTVTTPISQNGSTVGLSQVRVQTYGYDDAGRKTSVTSQLGTVAASGVTPTGTASALQFGYYPNGRLQVEIGRDGGTISHEYDAAGDQTVVSGSAYPVADVTATYYLDGLLRSAQSQSRVTTFAYDGAGREIAHDAQTTSGSPAPGTTLTTYGDAGLRTQLTSPASASGSAGDLGAGRFAWAYDIGGRVASQTSPNGAVTSFTWANDDTLTSKVVQKSASDPTVLSQWVNEYDHLYRQTKSTFSGVDTTGAVNGVVSSYTYTPGGRLESFTHGSTAKYVTWDHNGNRMCYGADCDHGSVQPTGTSRVKFSYRADNSIASEDGGGTPYQYPAANASGTTPGDVCNTYDYDGFDRLTTVTPRTTTGCANTSTTTYKYDGLDRQVSQQFGSATTTTLYLGLSTSSDRSVGSSTVDYAVDAAGQPLAVRDSSQTQYLGIDGRGSVGSVFSSASGVACQTAYDPFGMRINPGDSTAAPSCTAAATSNSRWFNGERRDESTSNYQFGGRTYDPGKGAFLTPDTFRSADPAADAALVSDPLTANRYAFVNGDPINLIDPTGHRPGCDEDSPGGRSQCPNEYGFVIVKHKRTPGPFDNSFLGSGDSGEEEEIVYCDSGTPYNGCEGSNGFRFSAAPSTSTPDPYAPIRNVVRQQLGGDTANDVSFLNGLGIVIDGLASGKDGLKLIGELSLDKQGANKQHYALVFDRFAKENGLTRTQLALLVVAIGVDTKKYSAEGASAPDAAVRSVVVNGAKATAGAGAFSGAAAGCALFSETIVIPFACGVIAGFLASRRIGKWIEHATEPGKTLEPQPCAQVNIENDPGPLSNSSGFRMRC
jgi:RHS repeat-associated protein